MLSNQYRSAIRRAIGVCEAVADGDFDARIVNIVETGEAGRLLHAINRLIDRTDAYVRESRASLEYVAANKYFRRISERGMTGAFGEASRCVNAAMASIEIRVSEFGRVVETFDGQMESVVGSVAMTAAELEQSEQKLEAGVSSTSEQAGTVSAAAKQASENVASVAAATEEMTNSAQEISEQVLQSSRTTTDTMREFERTMSDLKALESSSTRIGEIVGLKAEIAEQKDLLALNASIEAARVGEAGRGFAVVASEVKELAGQSAGATERIKTQIADIQSVSSQVIHSFRDIQARMHLLDEASAAIAAAIEEQRAATCEVARNIERAAEGTSAVSSNIAAINHTASSSGTIAVGVRNASSDLAERSTSMRRVVEAFLSEVHTVI